MENLGLDRTVGNAGLFISGWGIANRFGLDDGLSCKLKSVLLLLAKFLNLRRHIGGGITGIKVIKLQSFRPFRFTGGRLP